MSKKTRDEIGVSIHNFSLAFDLNPPTLQRLESGKNADLGTLRRIQIYIDFPKVALWQLELNSGKLHPEIFHKMWSYFEVKQQTLKNK